MDGILGLGDNRSTPFDPRQLVATGVERLKARIEGGNADTGKLQRELTSIFGDDAAGIVGEDGSVSYERLRSLAVDRQTTKLLLELTTRYTEARDEAIRPDGSVDSERLRAEVVGQRQEVAKARIREEFGDDAEQFFNPDGSIDFQAMREFFERQNAELDRLRSLRLGPASLVDVET